MKSIFPLFLLLIGSCVSGQNKLLRYQLRKGDAFIVHFHSERQSVQKNGTAPVVVTWTEDASISLKVIVEKRNGYEFEASYQQLSLSVKSDLFTNEILLSSTDSTSTDLSSVIFRKMLGQPFFVKMNTEGYIEKIAGLDQLFDKEANKHNYLPDSIQSVLKSQLVTHYGEVELRNTLQPYTHIYPAVLAGTTNHWSTKSNITSPSSFNIIMYYVMDEPTRLRLNGFGDLFLQYEREETRGEKIPVRRLEEIKLLGKITAEIDIDVRTGFPVKTFMVQNFSGDSKEIRKGKDAVATPERVHREIRYEMQRMLR